jgi:excisionase family DNA binding protein
MPNDVLTMTETAEKAKVSKRTVERWISSGVLPVVRVGRIRRVRVTDLEALLSPT